MVERLYLRLRMWHAIGVVIRPNVTTIYVNVPFFSEAKRCSNHVTFCTLKSDRFVCAKSHFANRKATVGQHRIANGKGSGTSLHLKDSHNPLQSLAMQCLSVGLMKLNFSMILLLQYPLERFHFTKKPPFSMLSNKRHPLLGQGGEVVCPLLQGGLLLTNLDLLHLTILRTRRSFGKKNLSQSYQSYATSVRVTLMYARRAHFLC